MSDTTRTTRPRTSSRSLGSHQAGDDVTFSDVLRNGQGKAVGTEAGSGVITRSNAPTKHLAITGGTGQYVSAAGDLELVENGDGTGRLTLTLR